MSNEQEMMNVEFWYSDAIYDGDQIISNCCWVHRKLEKWPRETDDRTLMRRARQIFGWTGSKGEWLDDQTWKPRNAMVLLQILINDDLEA